jgi:hypothetical protein
MKAKGFSKHLSHCFDPELFSIRCDHLVSVVIKAVYISLQQSKNVYQ